MAKRYNEIQSLKDLMKTFIKDNNLTSGIAQEEVREAWDDVMGNGIAQYTTHVDFKQGTLFITLNSSVLKQELSFAKDKIIKMMNEHLKSDLIKNVMIK